MKLKIFLWAIIILLIPANVFVIAEKINNRTFNEENIGSYEKLDYYTYYFVGDSGNVFGCSNKNPIDQFILSNKNHTLALWEVSSLSTITYTSKMNPEQDFSIFLSNAAESKIRLSINGFDYIDINNDLLFDIRIGDNRTGMQIFADGKWVKCDIVKKQEKTAFAGDVKYIFRDSKWCLAEYCSGN